MGKIKNLLIISFLFSSLVAYSIDWQTTAAVSIASSYLGCVYFKKKARLHSSQFWKDVAAGASISFVSGRCLEWWLLSQARATRKSSTDPGYTPANFHGGNYTNTGLQQITMPDISAMGSIRMKFLDWVIPVIISLISFYLSSRSQVQQQKNNQCAAEALQNKEHRFQSDQAEKARAAQEQERRKSEKFVAQENEKNRKELERVRMQSIKRSAAEEAQKEELFMDQFRFDTSKLKDRSSLGYIPEEVKIWLSDLDNGVFSHQHILLSGYAGSGKSHAINVVACEIRKNCELAGKRVEVFTVRQGRMCGRHMSETLINLEDFFKYVEKYAKQDIEVIILWDEIDVLTSGTLSDDSAGHDINSTIGVLKEILDSENLSKNVRILATTNHPDKINDAIKSRFKSGCELKLPTRVEREKLLRFLVKDEPCKEDKIWKKYAQKTEGWSLRDLQKFFKDAQKMSKGSFDKALLKSAFNQVVSAKKAGKKDFSLYESQGNKVKRLMVQGVYAVVTAASSFVSGIAGALGGYSISWFMG